MKNISVLTILLYRNNEMRLIRMRMIYLKTQYIWFIRIIFVYYWLLVLGLMSLIFDTSYILVLIAAVGRENYLFVLVYKNTSDFNYIVSIGINVQRTQTFNMTPTREFVKTEPFFEQQFFTIIIVHVGLIYILPFQQLLFCHRLFEFIFRPK